MSPSADPHHPARRALVAAGPGDASRQGGRLTRDPGRSPVWFLAILLGLFALASMALNALPYLTLPAAVAVPLSPLPATDGSGLGDAG